MSNRMKCYSDSRLDESFLDFASTETHHKFSQLLEKIEQDIETYTAYHIDKMKRQVRIGLALSSERDIVKLLDMIVSEARRLTHADAGTLYIRSNDGLRLHFHIIQNDSLGVHKQFEAGDNDSFLPVELYIDGQPNFKNVSSYVALTGEMVNIEDVYQVDGFDFTGPRRYDKETGYRSKSMLVISLPDHEGECIGVLQLLNAKNPQTQQVIAFHKEYEEMAASLASQAAISLASARLISGLESLFHSFIKGIAAAIDCKSPYTGGHVRRVVTLSMMLAEAVNAADSEPFADTKLSQDEIEELRLAAWLHDVGKITTPEHIIDKRTKLETVFDRIECVSKRFDLAKKCLESDILQQRILLYQNGHNDPEAHRRLERDLQEGKRSLDEDKYFVIGLNRHDSYLDNDALARLRDIAKRSYVHDGRRIALISADELENLQVPAGTLTSSERKLVERHALMTENILKEIPFPKKYSRVPQIAGSHHEHLDGSGYPHGRQGSEITLQSRILAIADIFEALTARDRPYKHSLHTSEALDILRCMKDAGSIDVHLFDLFCSGDVIARYMETEFGAGE